MVHDTRRKRTVLRVFETRQKPKVFSDCPNPTGADLIRSIAPALEGGIKATAADGSAAFRLPMAGNHLSTWIVRRHSLALVHESTWPAGRRRDGKKWSSRSQFGCLDDRNDARANRLGKGRLSLCDAGRIRVLPVAKAPSNAPSHKASNVEGFAIMRLWMTYQRSSEPLEVLAQFLWHPRAGVLHAVSHKPAARRVYEILIYEMSSWDSPNET